MYAIDDNGNGFWDPSDPLIAHGEGIIVRSPVTTSATISGTYQAPSLPLTLAPGFHLIGRQEVGLGSFENIVGRSPADYTSAKIYRLEPLGNVSIFGVPVSYRFYSYQSGIWSPYAPVLQVGEGAFIEVGNFVGGAPAFAVNGIFPREGGDCVNSFDVVLTGNGFNGTESVTLQGSSGPVIGTGVTADANGFLLHATFDLTHANFGTVNGPHNVTVQGASTFTLSGAFNRKSCGTDINVQLVGPSLVGGGNLNSYPVGREKRREAPASSVMVELTGVPLNVTLVYPSPQTSQNIPLTGTSGGFQLTIPALASGASETFTFNLTAATLAQTYTLQADSSPTPYLDTDLLAVVVVVSQDPNDKIGPIGVGSGHYVTGYAPFTHQIACENKPNATAPAQKVLITDQLDATKLDVQSLTLGTMTFGSFVVTPPAGVSTYNADWLYDVNGTPGTTTDDVIVRITVTFDNVAISPTFGKVTWLFETLDPITLMPPGNPLIGFLPPNITPPEGQGTVSFTVSPHSYLASGDIIANDARIFFDFNPHIDTGPWNNTIDKTAPASSVQALPPTQSTVSFPVNWSGADADSGIASYDVYVSANNGPFTQWQTATTATSGNYTGLPGHTYRFYSVAKDLVGHVESSPVSPDTVTTIRPRLSIVRAGGGVIISWDGSGVLQAAGEVTGPWTDVTGATSPYSTALSETNQFYFLRP